MSDGKIEYPRYLVQVGEKEPEFVPADEAARLLGAERSDVTFRGSVQVGADYIVGMRYSDVVVELGIAD